MFMLSLEAGPSDENKEILVDQYVIDIFSRYPPLFSLVLLLTIRTSRGPNE